MSRLFPKILIIPVLWALGTGWNLGTFDRRAEILRRRRAEFVTLPRPEIARFASLGFRSLLSDLYWIGALNYFGDDGNARVAYGELTNYLELVVALDPDFKAAYSFGGVSMPWNRGNGWANVDPAISLMERGVKRFPDDWRLRFQLAYTYSAYRSRYKDAGDQLAAAALIPGSPPFVASLATRMYATTGDYDGALLLGEQIFRSSPDPETRAGMARRIAELGVVKDVVRLEKAVAQFEAVHHRFPKDLQELVSAGIIPGVPRERLGGFFTYDPATGKVESSVLHERLQIYQPPGKK